MTATESRTSTGSGRRRRPGAPSVRAQSRVQARRARVDLRGPRAVSVGSDLLLVVVSSLLALAVHRSFTRPFEIPIVYEGDSLAGGAQVKGVLENGWYERNPALGAPFGQNFHDFPLADNLQFVLVRVLGLFTDQWGAVYNLIYLSTFPLSAVAAAWFIRQLGGRRSTAFAFGLLFAFTPYHFLHGQPHLSLSMIFVVPLAAGLLLRALSDRPLWARRERGARWNPITWATAPTAGTLLVLVLLGSTSSYYAVFFLLLATIVVAVLLLRRRLLAATGTAVAMAGLIAVMLVNMAPDLLYARATEPSPAAFARPVVHSEIYALKFAQLVFPQSLHQVDALAQFRQDYDTTFPNPAEYPALGIVATLGFLFLLALPLLLLMLRRPVRTDGPPGRMQDLALLTLVAFLFGTAGGLGTLFALFVSPDIRAWNRIAIYLALFALAAAALVADQLTARLRARSSRGRVVAGAAVGLIVVVGLYDATPVGLDDVADRAVRDYRNDAAYVAAVEQEVPAGTEVFELPYLPYPEAAPATDMKSYDPIRPYLHSSGLEWSYGGVSGRPPADWQASIAGLPHVRMLVAITAAGFGGVHLDRNGYPDGDPGQLGDDLRELAGEPVVSPDGRFEFFDLAPLRADLESSYSAGELEQIGQDVLRRPVFYWQPGFTGPPTPDALGDLYLQGLEGEDPEGVFLNPGRAHELRMRFEVHVEAADYPTQVTLTYPDGETKTVSVDEDGTEVSRNVQVPRGRSTLGFDLEPGSSLTLENWLVRDPGLAFPLRGLAAEVEARSAPVSTSGEGLAG